MSWRQFILWIFGIKPVVYNRHGPGMTEEEISAALNVGDKNPQLRAVLQLLDEYEQGARVNIGEQPGNPHLVSWHAAGADKVALFREFLLQRQAKARGVFKADPTRLARVAVSTKMRDARGRTPEDEE